jgi:hypothetical protein
MISGGFSPSPEKKRRHLQVVLDSKTSSYGRGADKDMPKGICQ